MLYLDTSAFLKMVWEEPESAALQEFIGDQSGISSVLLGVEARRGTLREAPKLMPRTDLLLGDLVMIEISDAVIESAGRLPDQTLRSLDAIHLATALLIRDDIDALLSYDDRLLAAAAAHGLPAASPA